jgi:hypothetical protein
VIHDRSSELDRLVALIDVGLREPYIHGDITLTPGGGAPPTIGSVTIGAPALPFLRGNAAAS